MAAEDHEDAAREQPEQTGHPAAQVEPVESQNATTAENPEKIRDRCALHANYLGGNRPGFLAESGRSE
jgi:hypothetical protein